MKISERSIKEARNILLAITPDLTAILDELNRINKMRISDATSTPSQQDAVERGIEVIKELLTVILDTQYDAFTRVLGALYDMKSSEFEVLTIEAVIKMIEETLSDEMLVRFFPSLRRLARKT